MRTPDKSHSRLHFAHSTRAISAEGGVGTGQIALSPAFRALDTHDLLRGLRAHGTNRTSPAFRASNLQNERFVRDFLKNSHVKVCKRSVSYEISSESQAETPIGAHTARSPAKQFRDSNSASTRLMRTKYCACHEMPPPSHLATSQFPAPATRIALPRLKTCTKAYTPATKNDNTISCEFQQNFYHATHLE